jgi:hypothetical protein
MSQQLLSETDTDPLTARAGARPESPRAERALPRPLKRPVSRAGERGCRARVSVS